MKYLQFIAARLLVASIMLSSSMASSAQSKTYFRYLNDKGLKVISDSISPKYVVRGYDIIDSSGRVIQSVAPEPSTEEKMRLAKEKTEQERLAKWDKRLLLRYSHIDDISDTKARKLRDIDNDIFNLNLTVNNINQEIKHYQAKAANNERQGKDINENTLSVIQKLQQDKSYTIDQIQLKQEEKQQVADSFDKDLERFKVIRPETVPETQPKAANIPRP